MYLFELNLNNLYMENTVKERLIRFMKYKGIGQSKFEKLVGLSNGYINQLRHSPSPQKIQMILEKFNDLNQTWLLTGQGEMINQEKTNENTGVPFYSDLPVSAGKLEVITADASPSGYVDLPGLRARALFPVVGCSMKPDINPGDVIGIENVERPERIDPDKVYLIITTDQRMIKHLEPDPQDDEILWGVSPNYHKIKIYKSEIKYIYQVTYVGRLI